MYNYNFENPYGSDNTQDIYSNRDYCPRCGGRLMPYCPRCGHEPYANMPYCPGYGPRFRGRPNPRLGPGYRY